MYPGKVLKPNLEINRRKPTNLVLSGDIGLTRESGDLIDLHVLLTDNSPHVRLIPIVTNVMRPSGLMHGSIAVVDRGIQPRANSIVMVRFNGTEVIRHLKKKDGIWKLVADDPREEQLLITDEDIVEKLGVVTASITLLHSR